MAVGLNNAGARDDDLVGTTAGESRFFVTAPTVEPPKGGGALRGIAEKFTANPATGTASATIPIALSAGRSGFGPQLALAYESSTGNGIFGMGWALRLGEITRRTAQGLPTYDDDADVFQLSGLEDLVPMLVDGKRHSDSASVPGYTINRYRPRTETQFARIERWTRADGDIHWRSISRDNVLTIYGLHPQARISHPDDSARVFSWLICEQRDDKGNAIAYTYRADDDTGVDRAAAHEANRTARSVNRYPDRIRYGNRVPALDAEGKRPVTMPADWNSLAHWMFEVAFDYGDYHLENPSPLPSGPWPHRRDAFSTRRPGFEVRTTRLCSRLLMFHHFPELGVPGGCLVRSTDLTYAEPPSRAYTFLSSATHTGYRRTGANYSRRSYPPVEFSYSAPALGAAIEVADTPGIAVAGIERLLCELVDLDGHGAPGVLFDYADNWRYSSNTSPAHSVATFAPPKPVAGQPNPVGAVGRPQLMDLAGNGGTDLAVVDGDLVGSYAHDFLTGWAPHRAFRSGVSGLPSVADRRLIDLTGDGRADILITEDDLLVWHESLGADGFDTARRVWHAFDGDEHCPRLVFSDGTDTIFLADMTGDSLTDLVRVRNDNVCYWPNLGYGRFGAKITLDHTQLDPGGQVHRWVSLDSPERFDPKRVILTDIDGSGTTDLIYLHPDGVDIYINSGGNALRSPQRLMASPPSPLSVTVAATDLLGEGTPCLVWASPLPADAQNPLRYIRLMAAGKPHLLTGIANNLGAETQITYTTSTAQAVADERRGHPWRTRIGFPVHVVDTVTVRDHLSGNRFTATYRYHDGYYDRSEREFGGFGCVDVTDTELISAVGGDTDALYTVPPTMTRTWYHTGADEHAVTEDRFRHPTLDSWHINDTVLPDGASERADALRALRGSMLRQETYALDAADATPENPGPPYAIAENTFTVVRLQPAGPNKHAAFLTHPRETMQLHLERVPNDPRITHTAVLRVDEFGNTLDSVAIAYGRRAAALEPGMEPTDTALQQLIHIALTQNTMTDPIDGPLDYRWRLPAQTCTYELRRPTQESGQTRIPFAIITSRLPTACDGHHDINFEDVAFATAADKVETNPEEANNWFRRLTNHQRWLYRADDLSTLLPLTKLESRGLTGETYRLVVTDTLLDSVYQRDGQTLITDPTTTLRTRGGYLPDSALAPWFPDGAKGRWWMPSGRTYLAPPGAASERDHARRHFFLPYRFVDPFGNVTTVTYDSDDADPARDHMLLAVETADAVGNTVTAYTADDIGNTRLRVDYRVLQPYWVTDPNGNRTRVAFDTLGLVAATAVMGKPQPHPVEGDSISDAYVADLTETQLDDILASPLTTLPTQLGTATRRFVYDISAFHRSKRGRPETPSSWHPAWVASIARDTHLHGPTPHQGAGFQIAIGYSDGFDREIQHKTQAPPTAAGERQWIGSGWTIYNNKSDPVRQYHPFFTARHQYERQHRSAIGPVAFYDPLRRPVATLHPDHTWQKTHFTPWRSKTWDQSDLVLTDPSTDPTLQPFTTAGLPRDEYIPSWHALRTDPAHAALFEEMYPDVDDRAAETVAAKRAAAHADTPSVAHFDALGRAFLTVAHNRVASPRHPDDGQTVHLSSRTTFDSDGNVREVRDPVTRAHDANGNPTTNPLGRTVVRYDYDLAGNQIHSFSMDAGRRWTVADIAGNEIAAWDSRGHTTISDYDALRRPTQKKVRGDGPDCDDRIRVPGFVVVEQVEYGDALADPGDAAIRNLRGRIARVRDPAGEVRNAAFDFKGNLLRSTRQLVVDATTLPDWSTPPPLEHETFSATTRYDALNRPVQMIAPNTGHGTSVIQHVHNEAGQLTRVDVWLQRPAEPTSLIDPTVVPPSAVGIAHIDYDAKGQRQQVNYRNGATTTYQYDSSTLRLSKMRTARPTSRYQSDTAVQPGWPGALLQNLHYAYDPVGNIIRIRDTAQQRIFFSNAFVDPSNDYSYDALYRLIEGTGRQQLVAGHPVPHSHNDRGRVGKAHPGDGHQIARYTERFVYDTVGNLESLNHHVTSPTNPDWKRTFNYQTPSRIESSGVARAYSNRLTSSTVGTTTETYTYDPHGNTTRMPHLGDGSANPNMGWDYYDMLRHVDRGGGGRTHCIYNSTGERIRKITRKGLGRTEERIYLGAFEIHRQYGAGDVLNLERETLHISDGQHRFALVETRTEGNDPAPQQLVRYQHGNHIGSATIELDDTSRIISYEEYSPYGSTTYQALNTPAPKRYRYTAKERDEETGFIYHGARYCIPWLGRWTSCDPAGTVDGPNVYAYVQSNPICLRDPSGRQATGVQGNRAAGLAAADALKRQVEAKGHGVQTEVTVKGGKGGSRIDIAPDPKAPQTIAKTLESKHIDVSKYRTPQGTLDVARLQAEVRADLAQVQKHESALRLGRKPDLPFRESVVYTLENAQPGEAAQFQNMFRQTAQPTGIKGGVLQAHNRQLHTASGRPLSADAKPPPSKPPAPGGVAPSPRLTIGGAALGAAGTALSGYGFYQDVSQGNVAGATFNAAGFAGGGLALGGAAVGSAGLATAGTVLAIPAAAYGLGKGALEAGSADFAAAAGAALDGPSAKGPTIGGAAAAGVTAIATAPYFVVKGVFNQARDAGNWLGDAAYRMLN